MTVQLRDLTIQYGRFVAVKGVTAEFPRGSVGLLGRNGAGKSSVLKALLGLLRPTGGQMQILDLPENTAPAEIRRVVGYMPERESHIPLLNGYETVRLAAELTGLPRLAAARRAHEVLYFAGLDEQRYRPVSGYSTGMKQKVKLATALVHDPQVLFLDEPTNGLDPAGRRDMLRLIQDLTTKFGKSIILSSHILSDVEQVCEHVVLMEEGEVLTQGSVKELTSYNTRIIHLVVGGDTDAACEALRPLAVQPVETQEMGRCQVTVAEDMETERLFAAVRDAGGVVKEFREHRRTLEEVFLSAVRTAEGQDGPTDPAGVGA
jgi:ABC-2 type transport system ATP-binding protein